MASRFVGMIPGMGLLRQAYDATRLAGAIINKKKERALVLAEERHKQMAQYRNANANKKLKELFEAKKYEEVAMLFFPGAVVNLGKDFAQFWWKVWDIYWIFVLLRILLAFLPQTGYIHPDEFFQSVEVIAGDVLDVDVVRTWEFNVSYPLRSVTIPYVILGGPFYMLKITDYLLYFVTGWTLIGPTLVFLLPRLVMLALSFVVDWCVYKICVLYRHSYNQCLTTLASSYVMLIYANRTFSNTIELVLVSILLYLVAHCMKRTSETVYLQSMIHDAYEKAETTKEKVQIQKKNKLIPGHNFKHVLPISVICAVGFFNRPTFVVFAAVPLFYWFLRGIASNSYLTPFQMFNFRCLSVIPGFVVTSLIIFLLDSLYYGELTLLKLWNLEMAWSDWKFTPLHFVMYNLAPENLDKHGTHPLYLHSLVNIPLLYGPLGVCALISAMTFISEMISNDWRHKPSVINVYALNLFTFLSALVGLSLIPHQEPRFLIPLIVPIVLMNAHKLRWKFSNNWKPILTLWYIFNIFFVFFYGFLHQGGVHGVIKQIAKSQNFPEGTTKANFVFSHVYMPPKFQLLQISENKFQEKKSLGAGDDDFPAYFRKPNSLRINFIDLAGKSLEDDVKREIFKLANEAKKKSKFAKTSVENFIVLPTHLMPELEDCTRGTFSFKPITKVFPHVGTESMPKVFEPLLPFIHFNGDWTPSVVAAYVSSFLYDVIEVIGQFSLSVYKFEIMDGVKVVELKNFTSVL